MPDVIAYTLVGCFLVRVVHKSDIKQNQKTTATSSCSRDTHLEQVLKHVLWVLVARSAGQPNAELLRFIGIYENHEKQSLLHKVLTSILYTHGKRSCNIIDISSAMNDHVTLLTAYGISTSVLGDAVEDVSKLFEQLV